MATLLLPKLSTWSRLSPLLCFQKPAILSQCTRDLCKDWEKVSEKGTTPHYTQHTLSPFGGPPTSPSEVYLAIRTRIPKDVRQLR